MRPWLPWHRSTPSIVLCPSSLFNIPSYSIPTLMIWHSHQFAIHNSANNSSLFIALAIHRPAVEVIAWLSSRYRVSPLWFPVAYINLQLQDLVWKLSSMTAEVLELLQLHSGNWAAMGEDVKCSVYSGSPCLRRLIPFHIVFLRATVWNAAFSLINQSRRLNCRTICKLNSLSAMTHCWMQCFVTRECSEKRLCTLISYDNNSPVRHFSQ